MKLKELIQDIDFSIVQGDLDIEINDISMDSREVNIR